MGMSIAQIDIDNVLAIANRVVGLADYRAELFAYLQHKMNTVAPNLSALIGDVVGARLIAHAGSLTTLAKYPASTVQILGAEKALFRALKTKGNTPKYGLIFNSTYIGRASTKNKGRISRYLANKTSIAARVDAFSEGEGGREWGERLAGQVEERLAFYDSGAPTRKNIDVMREAAAAAKGESGATLDFAPPSSSGAAMETDSKTPEKKSKKEKKEKSSSKKEKKDKSSSKKEKKDKSSSKTEKAESAVAMETDAQTPEKASKKSDKKDKSKKDKSDKKEKSDKKKDKKRKRDETPEEKAARKAAKKAKKA